MDINDPLLYDTIAITTLSVSVLLAFSKGFIRELFSLLEWVCACLVTYLFYDVVAAKIATNVTLYGAANLISIALLFSLSFIGFYILGRLLLPIFQKNLSTGTDRLLGLIFGLFRGTLIPCLLFNFLLLFAVLPSMTQAIINSHSYGVVSFITYNIYGKSPKQLMLENNRAFSPEKLSPENLIPKKLLPENLIPEKLSPNELLEP